jgi:hypothetical protein
MKKIFTHFAIIAFICFHFNASAQLDTSNGRYYNFLFSNVTTTSNVVFGSYINFGLQNNLTMDIYQPTGDLVTMRPLIILAHGGSFQFGDKSEADIVLMCQRFTKMGYVTCSINYRTGFFPIDSVNATQAVLKATQDMKAAVRFFRKDAATANTYKIHPDYIYVGGSSAGAFMALHLAYMDKSTEFPLGATVLNSLGGLEGTSGNPGYPSNASAVVNLCGALGDASYLEAGDVPLVSMHGDADATVPYAHAIIVSLGFSVMYVDGSSAIHARANTVGVYNPFYTFSGADHVPYLNDSMYLDTTINYVRDFLRPLVSVAPLKVAKPTESLSKIQVYPNPVEELIQINFNQSETGLVNYYLLDLSGREVKSGVLRTQTTALERNDLQAGTYILKFVDSKQQVQVNKLILR